MERLYIYADFDWISQPTLIGELTFEQIRGNASYSFTYDNNWLSMYPDVFLDRDIQCHGGIQFSTEGHDIFGCVSDILPQRWGRTLFNLKERVEAVEEKRHPRKLSSFDYLLAINDISRIGGFRLAKSKGEEFINTGKNWQVPSLKIAGELSRAANEIEESGERHTLPSKKWIVQLIHPGTSLGGARPKASVLDDNGALTVAKFPSRKDEYDIAVWEHFCHLMARKVGINAAHTRVIPGDKYHIFLSKRFDRTQDNRRIHFASALTLLGLTDGNNASTNHGYLDIVDFIIQHGANAEKDLQELYRRVAFNIIVGNSDDHFRNHGFLLTPKGWTLSPVYDMNPTLSDNQSLLINSNTNESNLDTLLESASEYMLTKDEASSIIEEVKLAMQSWRKEAQLLNLPKRDIDMFAPRIDKWL